MKGLIIFSALLLLAGAHGDTGSKECKMSGYEKSEMVMAQEFMEDFVKSCLNITCPEELKQIAKECIRKTIMNTTIIKDLPQGIFPDKNAIVELLKNIEMCKLRDAGIQNPETNIDAEGLIRAFKFDQWKGDQQEINMVRDKMRECMNRAQGTTTMEKLMSHHKCMVNNLIDYCTAQGEDPGIMLVLAAKLLTINDNSKCAPVRVPQDFKTGRRQCMEDAKRNMNATKPSEIERQSNPVKKMKLIAKYFVQEFLTKSMECCLDKKGLYDNSTRTLNVQAFADYIKNLQGWNNIMQERDTVYNAILDCGKAFKGDSNNVGGGSREMNGGSRDMNGGSREMNDGSREMSGNSRERNDNNSFSSETNMKDDRMKQMWMEHSEFEKCFGPIFAKSCGINNEISTLLYPVLDSEFMGDVFKAFMEIGGKDVMNIFNDYKQKF